MAESRQFNRNYGYSPCDVKIVKQINRKYRKVEVITKVSAMSKLMSLFILLFSSHLMAGETCTPQDDLIISSERTGVIEDLNTPLNNLVCTGKIKEKKFD